MTDQNARSRRLGLLAASAVAIAGCATSTPANGAVETKPESERAGVQGVAINAAESKPVAEGRRIAQRECAACHSIDQSSVSPDPAAPAFRDFMFLNDPNWVAYRLMDGMRMGHDKMPLFDLDVKTTDSLIAFLKSIDG